MKDQNLARSQYFRTIVTLVAVLVFSTTPAQRASAQGTSTSDLAVDIISMPKHAKACETFEATFTITNFGPDPASQLNIMVLLPDPFSLVDLLGAPESLAVGEAVTFSALIKVVAFVPGETRKTWLGIDAVSDPYPDISIDPNPENNPVFRQIKLNGKPVMSCNE